MANPNPLARFAILPTIMSFVVASALKEELKKAGMMTAGDFADAMSAYVQAAAKAAAKRAKENGRVTVRPCDL